MHNLMTDQAPDIAPLGDNKREREHGAAAIIVALLLPVLFGSLALALDFGKLVYERHHLTNALDAAALAGAGSLPNDPTAAKSNALKFAKDNDPEAVPAISFWCIVASTGTAKTVASGQIPSVCNPGPITGAKCNETICAIPCVPAGTVTCNSITVIDDKDVPYNFAPVIGFKSGNTGAIAANACRGSCGSLSPNPMDVAVVADRTGSMSIQNLTDMKTGIKNTLLTMSKDQQFVALGTIHRSSPNATCQTSPSISATTGPWIPVPFSNDYNNSGSTPTANGNSALVKAITCLNTSSGNGTYLAAPMKAAARYVLGKDPNNLATLLPARTGTARKAIILETDGQPNESNITGFTAIDTPGDIGTTNVYNACRNLMAVAADAKLKGILIITVGFGSANTDSCGNNLLVRDALAGSASEKSPGVPSTAGSDCQTPAKRATENSDGDYFFCAASGTEMGPIFVSAINAISSNSRLVRIPL